MAQGQALMILPGLILGDRLQGLQFAWTSHSLLRQRQPFSKHPADKKLEILIFFLGARRLGESGSE